MRDANPLTDYLVTDQTGKGFEIIGTYLTQNGSIYIKLKRVKDGIFVNHLIGDFKVFLEKNNFVISVKPNHSENHIHFSENPIIDLSV
jgi:hypothetical protein